MRIEKTNFARKWQAILREQWCRWRYFEHWPTRLFYAPIYPLIAYWSIRFRSLDFMSMVNPCMEFGGLLNYSKSEILARLAKDKRLRACLVSCGEEKVLEKMAACGLEFPIVAKPDCGERGFAVEVIRSHAALMAYLAHFRRALDEQQSIILQEYFHPAKEFAVLYSIAPSEIEQQKLGEIRSVCAKEPIVVTGDAAKALWQLIVEHPRGARYFRMLRRKWQKHWDDVLPAGQELELTSIGAHSLGTTCYSLQEKNSEQLLKVFAELTAPINSGNSGDSGPRPEFCFGRYDILAKDWDSVLAGDFKVIELNGVNAEPIHIYQPNYPLWQAWKTLWAHWMRIAALAREMQARGLVPGSSKRLFQAVRAHDERLRHFEALKKRPKKRS